MSHTIKDDFSEDEELVQNCIECIRYEHRATVSLLQRRFRIGYTRAKNIMQELVRRGVVGSVDSDPSGGAEYPILIELKELEQPKPSPIHTKEPWKYLAFPSQTEELSYEDYNNAVTCVNACAGMENPAEQIKAMRDCLKEIVLGGCEGSQDCSCRQAELPQEDWCIPCKCGFALNEKTKL